jgi:hypothetical protein
LTVPFSMEQILSYCVNLTNRQARLYASLLYLSSLI